MDFRNNMENEIKNFEYELMSQIGALIEGAQSPDGIKQFILSELKALKEECVGEDVKHDDFYCDNLRADGYNQKREEIIKAFEKRGV